MTRRARVAAAPTTANSPQLAAGLNPSNSRGLDDEPVSTRSRLDPRVKAMSEAALQSAITECAMLLGWKVTYQPDAMKRLAYAAMRSGKGGGGRWPEAGFPDLLMARDGRLILAELKSHKGQVKPAQEEWLQTVATVENVEVFIWRPADWLAGDIEEVLK